MLQKNSCCKKSVESCVVYIFIKYTKLKSVCSQRSLKARKNRKYVYMCALLCSTFFSPFSPLFFSFNSFLFSVVLLPFFVHFTLTILRVKRFTLILDNTTSYLTFINEKFETPDHLTQTSLEVC